MILRNFIQWSPKGVKEAVNHDKLTLAIFHFFRKMLETVKNSLAGVALVTILVIVSFDLIGFVLHVTNEASSDRDYWKWKLALNALQH